MAAREAEGGADVPLVERRRVAQLLRELGCEVVTSDAPDTDFAPLAAALAPLRDALAPRPRVRRSARGLLLPEHAAARTGREPAYDRDPLIGLSNVLAPPLRRVAGEPGVWEVTFGALYEGHPGFVHGGFVAAVLDHVLGVAASSAGVAAMTGTLTTRYRRPTPVDTRLVGRGAVARVEGRKVFCTATLAAGEEIVAESDGIYLRVDADRY